MTRKTGEGEKRVNNMDGVVVTAAVMAKLFGLSSRRIRQLSEEGIIPKLPNGSYQLVDTVRAYILYLKTAQQQEKIAVDYEREKAYHEKAKREKAELILGEMKGELHDSKTVERVMGDMLSSLRSKLLSIPSKLAPFLVNMEQIPEIQEKLEHSIYETLEELSEYTPTLFFNEKYIEQLDAEEEEIE